MPALHVQIPEVDMRAFCFGLEHREGKDMFLPIVLPKAGFTLRFRVKGQHIRLALTNQREETRNKDASGAFHCYFMAIGAFRNQKTYFKRSNKSGDPVLALVRIMRKFLLLALRAKLRVIRICRFWSTRRYFGRSVCSRIETNLLIEIIILQHFDIYKHFSNLTIIDKVGNCLVKILVIW